MVSWFGEMGSSPHTSARRWTRRAPGLAPGLLVLVVGSAVAWAPSHHSAGLTPRGVYSREAVVVEGGRAATPLGRMSTPAGKSKTISEVTAAIEESSICFAFPGQGLDIKSIAALRSKLPEASTARMVKNTLMIRAGVETGWSDETVEVSDPIFHGSNLWIFSGEDMRGTIEAYEGWLKDQGLKEGYAIKGGFMEGAHLNEDGVKAVIDLPTKPELMARLAGAINMAGPLGIATKLKNAKGNAQGLAVRLKQASGAKLATAIKLSVGDEEKNPNNT